MRKDIEGSDLYGVIAILVIVMASALLFAWERIKRLYSFVKTLCLLLVKSFFGKKEN